MKPLTQRIVLLFLLLMALQSVVGQPSPRRTTHRRVEKKASITPKKTNPTPKVASYSSFSPKVTSYYYKLGERMIQLKTYQYGNVKDMVYINLHDDEITSINGAKKILGKKGGYLIKIENSKTRNIKFKLDGQYYTVDPNRMFSRTGIAQSLLVFGRTSKKAIDEIEKFANRVLRLIPENPSCIIALHNNSNGKYSINSYLPGNLREKDAKQIHINPDKDADDLFLTTDSVLFSRLAKEKYNTIWQDNINAKKDGSLSVYCGENNMPYVNCETEHGQQNQYDEMIHTAINFVERKNPDIIAYNYKLLDPKANSHIKPENIVFFGEKKVGLIRATQDTSRTAIAKLEMDKNFRLYSNMDFFFFLSQPNSPRFEVRIDPTRTRDLIDPTKTVIPVKVVR